MTIQDSLFTVPMSELYGLVKTSKSEIRLLLLSFIQLQIGAEGFNVLYNLEGIAKREFTILCAIAHLRRRRSYS